MTFFREQAAPAWWRRPRQVAVVVDNPSWVLPYAEELVATMTDAGDRCDLYRSYEAIPAGAIAFFLGCIRIAPKEVVVQNHRTLVVHASPLPKGRGFSPLTWLILEGKNEIPVCLLDANEPVDSGPVIYRDTIRFEGHELIDELRHALGKATIRLCRRFLSEDCPPQGIVQTGEPSYYDRRRPADSELDPEKTLAAQFDLLRVVDNERYPAFFYHRGHCYELTVRKRGKADDT